MIRLGQIMWGFGMCITELDGRFFADTIYIKYQQLGNKQIEKSMLKLNSSHKKSSGTIAHSSKPSGLNNNPHSTGPAREPNYVRKFFQRRLKLEMKVRERIFREGRNNSRQQQSMKNKSSVKALDSIRPQNKEQKRGIQQILSRWRKQANTYEEISVNQSNDFNEESAGKNYTNNEKLKEDGTTKTTKSQSKWNQFQKGNKALQNFDVGHQLIDKTEIQSKFRKMCIKRNLAETKDKLPHKIIQNQHNFILTNQKFKPFQGLHQKPLFQNHQLLRKKQEQVNEMEYKFKKEKQEMKEHTYPIRQKQSDDWGELRGRSKGFKTEIGIELRNKLANMIYEQKLRQRMRDQTNGGNLSLFLQGSNTPQIQTRMLIKEQEKEVEPIYQSNPNLKSNEIASFNEKISIDNCETGIKRVENTEDNREQAKSGQEDSEILCAICQTNIPHNLWKSATFYDKNRVQYYKFYRIFQSQGSGLLQEDDEEESIIPLLLHCGHSFHRVCLEEWLRYKTVCPLCKTELDEVDGNQNEQDYDPGSEDASYDEPSWSEEDSPYYRSISYEVHNGLRNQGNSQDDVDAQHYREPHDFHWRNSSNSEPSEPSDEQNVSNNEHFSIIFDNVASHVRKQRVRSEESSENWEANEYECPNENGSSSEIPESEEPSQNWDESDSQLIYEYNIE